jgi:hypothetical protein
MAMLAVLTVIFIVQSCIPSLHPIYTADKLVVLDQIPGKWVNSPNSDQKFQITTDEGALGQPETWDFRKGEGKSYLLVHTDTDGRTAAFDVHIIKLGNHYFMDFYPTGLPEEDKSSVSKYFDASANENSFMAIHLLPVHTFAKLEVKPETLKISMFDPDFLKNLLENRQIRIKHEKVDNGYVLTASPEELQKFAEKYADEKAAFLDDPIELKIKL